jgi:molybdenum cofactor cytidylyltransferase
MPRLASASVTGLVLAAGGSRRLGEPKQLLPFGSVPLLGHVLDVARLCPFDQLLCVIGGQAHRVRDEVDFEGVQLLENTQFGDGCSSSIAVALDAIDPRSEVLVLMLGDQPGVTPSTVEALLAGRGQAPLAACSYENGRGHPLAFARSTFPELAALHGDKGVWKLLDRRAGEVADIAIDGPVPLDVDTWEGYEAVLEAAPRPL